MGGSPPSQPSPVEGAGVRGEGMDSRLRGNRGGVGSVGDDEEVWAWVEGAGGSRAAPTGRLWVVMCAAVGITCRWGKGRFETCPYGGQVMGGGLVNRANGGCGLNGGATLTSILSQDGDLCITAKCVIHPSRITPISIFPRQGGRGLGGIVDRLCKGLQDGRGGKRESHPHPFERLRTGRPSPVEGEGVSWSGGGRPGRRRGGLRGRGRGRS